MPHPVFVNSFKLRIQAAVAAAAHAGQIAHHGMAGEIREILVRDLLRPILPPSIAIGRGKIVDSHGNESRQIDVVIYDRAVMPHVAYGTGESLGVFPVEACVYAIEVKTKSTPQEMRKGYEIARSISALKYLAEVSVGAIPCDRVMCVYFAFGSNLKLSAANLELDRWMGLLKQWDLVARVHNGVHVGNLAFPPLRVVCVAGQGYGYYDPAAGAAGSYGWRAATSDHDEILWFLMGVANTLGILAGTRRGLPFGRYLG